MGAAKGRRMSTVPAEGSQDVADAVLKAMAMTETSSARAGSRNGCHSPVAHANT